jgi:hypothetical protein
VACHIECPHDARNSKATTAVSMRPGHPPAVGQCTERVEEAHVGPGLKTHSEQAQHQVNPVVFCICFSILKKGYMCAGCLFVERCVPGNALGALCYTVLLQPIIFDSTHRLRDEPILLGKVTIGSKLDGGGGQAIANS